MTTPGFRKGVDVRANLTIRGPDRNLVQEPKLQGDGFRTFGLELIGGERCVLRGVQRPSGTRARCGTTGLSTCRNRRAGPIVRPFVPLQLWFITQ